MTHQTNEKLLFWGSSCCFSPFLHFKRRTIGEHRTVLPQIFTLNNFFPWIAHNTFRVSCFYQLLSQIDSFLFFIVPLCLLHFLFCVCGFELLCVYFIFIYTTRNNRVWKRCNLLGDCISSCDIIIASKSKLAYEQFSLKKIYCNILPISREFWPAFLATDEGPGAKI